MCKNGQGFPHHRIEWEAPPPFSVQGVDRAAAVEMAYVPSYSEPGIHRTLAVAEASDLVKPASACRTPRQLCMGWPRCTPSIGPYPTGCSDTPIAVAGTLECKPAVAAWEDSYTVQRLQVARYHVLVAAGTALPLFMVIYSDSKNRPDVC